MPTISKFYEIIIRMFFEEHAPPHNTRNTVNLKRRLTFKRLMLRMENYRVGH